MPLSGEITGADIEQTISLATKGILAQVAGSTSRALKREIDPFAGTGRLKDSIHWKTSDGRSSGMGGRADKADALDAPITPDTVIIGTNNPYALFFNDGTSPHTNPEGKEEFLKSISDWALRAFGIHSDGPPEERSEYWALVNHIRKHGTSPHPFIQPVMARVPIYLKHAIASCFTAAQLFKKRGKK